MIGSCIVVGMHDFDGSIIKSHKIIKTLVISSRVRRTDKNGPVRFAVRFERFEPILKIYRFGSRFGSDPSVRFEPINNGSESFKSKLPAVIKG